MVSEDDEKYDTLKDPFWRELEKEGKGKARPQSDIYSRVKTSSRPARPAGILSEAAVRARLCKEAELELSHPDKKYEHKSLAVFQ